MRKLVATLQVYVSNNPEEISKETNYGDGKYEITVYPFAEENQLPILGINDVSEKTHANIFAHELGHFVGEVTNDLYHNRHFRMLFGSLPAERNAWEYAEKMMDVDKNLEYVTLKSYEE